MSSSPRRSESFHLATPLRLVLGGGLLACTPAALHPPPDGGAAGAAVPLSEVQLFWSAVTELELSRATRIAPGREHADFARGMRLVLDGRMEEAGERFDRLAGGAADSLVRVASRVALSSVLGYDGRWRDLYDLTASGPHALRAVGSGRAGLDLWSAAMRLAPEPQYRYVGYPVVLPFSVSGTGTPLVPVRINGRVRHFWLDTGTSLTLIASDVAADAGLTPLVPDTLEIVTSVGRIRALPASVSRLEVGPLAAADQPAAIVSASELTILNSLGDGRTELVKVDGVVGMDLMRHLNVVIDFPSGVAILARPRPEQDDRRKRNLFWLGYPVVRAEGPRGVPLYFGLDTGADSTYVTRNLIRKLPSRLLARRSRWIAGFGGDTLIRTPILSDLQVRAAGREFTLRNVAVRDSRRLMLFELDGILGTDVGLGHRVRIDITNGVFEVTSP
ncbi:MAG TPA: aspartyl protease family protein [Longimicrobiaceae bacterium]|nr:aspartyl protease family protein [Longimicrobiaceae bacterium]